MSTPILGGLKDGFFGPKNPKNGPVFDHPYDPEKNPIFGPKKPDEPDPPKGGRAGWPADLIRPKS